MSDKPAEQPTVKPGVAAQVLAAIAPPGPVKPRTDLHPNTQQTYNLPPRVQAALAIAPVLAENNTKLLDSPKELAAKAFEIGDALIAYHNATYSQFDAK